MNYITYNIASKKPLVVGFTEECNENHITFTGFEKQYEGDVSTVYLMVDDLGLYPLGPEGLEMTVDVRHTYREGRFDAILVERVADGSYCRKSTPFTYVVEHSPTVRHIAIPQTPQWQDWFGPMSELYQKVKMDYEDGKLGPKWGAIHGDINDQEDLIEKLDGDYQKKLTAGQNITITEVGDNVVISGAASNYHAGDNITIDSDNVISATDTTYSAGENISIDENNVISAVDTKAEWGDITGNIGEQEDLMNQFGILDDAIDDVADDLSDHMLDTDAHPTEAQKAEWSGKQDKLIAGEGIDITDNVISTTYADTVWGNISGDIEDQEDLTAYIATEIGKEAELRSTSDTNLTNTIQQVASNLGTHSSDTSKHVTSTEKASWTAKQDKLTAGTNITIDANNVISASGSLDSVDWGDIEGDIDNQTDLKNKFDSIDDKADEIAQDLADEVTRATGKETTIEGKVDTEVARATGEEARIEGKIDTHTSDSNIHVTAAKKSEWDAKMSEPSTEGTSGQALLTDGAGNRYWGNVASGEWGSISGNIADQTDLKNALDGLSSDISAEVTRATTEETSLANAINTHTGNTTIHVTSEDKSTWTNKQDKLTAGANITISDTGVISASGGLAEVSWGGITGTLENQTDLKSALAEKVDDVKINNTSIVTSGIANIPVADASTYGVVSVNQSYGITTTSNGQLRVSQATYQTIDERTNQYRPITAAGLDYAVKAALTDGVGDAYTSEEQAAARTRIGAVGTSHTHDDRYYTESEIDTKLADKADSTHTHTKSDITDFSHTHTTSEITDFAHTHDDRYYTEDEIDTKLAGKVSDVQVNGTSVTSDGVANITEASPTTYGVVKAYKQNGLGGVNLNANGVLVTTPLTEANIDSRSDVASYDYKPVTNSNLDYAVKAALTDGKGTAYTSTEQTAARTRLGAIGDVQVDGTSVVTDGVADIPVAGSSSGGVVRVSSTYGIGKFNTYGMLQTVKATTANIDARTNNYNPIVASNLDYAVKAALTDGKGDDWTSEEQEAARERLGVPEYSAGTNIDIDNNVISATDTTYTAGSGITISASHVISATGGGTADAIDWGHINGAISDQLDLQAELDNKADSTHTHDNRYYTEDEMDTKLGLKSDVGHKHVKADIQDFSHTHTKSEITDFAHTHDDRYYTETEVDNLLSNKSDTTHTHDDRYYTETEVDTLLGGKAAATHTHTTSQITDFAHTHDDRYYTESETDTKLATKVAIAQGATHAGQLLGINSEGNVTPIDAPITGVSDVEIGSTSLVDEDGVATLPYATTGQAGVVKPIASYGLTNWGTSGDLGLVRTTQAQIDARDELSLYPIIAGKLDYAVKAALTDGKGAAYTTTQQEAARTRIGAAASSHTHDDRYYTETEVDDKFTAVNTDIAGLEDDVEDIQALIPSEATSSNQLADKDFVNSSIATSTATFKGTFSSTSQLPTTGVDENDYAFVTSTDTAGNTLYNRYKYTDGEWLFEYSLNNSSFTAQQWASINSGATTTNIGQIATNKTNIESIIEDVADLTSGKSDVGHTHDDRYFTESEVTNKLLGKVDVNQGTSAAGKFLKVNTSGNVEAADIPDTGVLDVTVNGTIKQKAVLVNANL